MTTFELAQVLFIELGGAFVMAAPFLAALLLALLLDRWLKGW